MPKRYALRHRGQLVAIIERVEEPPRLSEWTPELDKAQLFKIESEAQACADHITKHAFNVEVFTVDVDEKDPRILAEKKR